MTCYLASMACEFILVSLHPPEAPLTLLGHCEPHLHPGPLYPWNVTTHSSLVGVKEAVEMLSIFDPNGHPKETPVLRNPCVFSLDIKRKKFPLKFAWCFHSHSWSFTQLLGALARNQNF